MIWSSRARNKSAPPLSRRSRGRIESPAPEASGARESELSIRVNPPFRFCKKIDPNTPKPGKIHTHDSRRCSHQSPLSTAFHGRLNRSRWREDRTHGISEFSLLEQAEADDSFKVSGCKSIPDIAAISRIRYDYPVCELIGSIARLVNSAAGTGNDHGPAVSAARNKPAILQTYFTIVQMLVLLVAHAVEDDRHTNG